MRGLGSLAVAVSLLLVGSAAPTYAEDSWERQRREREQAERRRQADQERFEQQQRARNEAVRQSNELRTTQVQGAIAASRAAAQSAPAMKKAPAGAEVVWSEGLTKKQAGYLRVAMSGLSRDARIDSCAFDPRGDGFVFIANRNNAYFENIPEDLAQELSAARDRNESIRSVAFSFEGGWAFLRGNSDATWSGTGVPPEAIAAIREVNAAKEKIWHLSFTPNGFVLVYGRNYVKSKNAPPGLVNSINTLSDGLAFLHSLSIRKDGAYVASVQGAYNYNGGALPGSLRARLTEAARVDRELTQVVLTPNGGWLALGQ